ncbi:unnamed protein product, partial [Polarella glacialis]
VLSRPPAAEEDEECEDLRPLFEERLGDPSAPCVTFDFGGGMAPLSLLQRPEAFRRSAAVGAEGVTQQQDCPTERTRRTGCVVWDASVVLAALVVSLASDGRLGLEGGAAVELGSGETGLVGLALARALGPSQTKGCVLTDVPELLPALQRNLERNAMAPNGAAVIARPFVWGQGDAQSGLATSQWPEALRPPFALLLAADCIYDTEN